MPPDVVTPTQASKLDCRCPDCDKAFANNASLANHRLAAHGKKSDAQLYCQTSACPVCLLDFFQHKRLQSHPRGSQTTKCLEWGTCVGEVGWCPFQVGLNGDRGFGRGMEGFHCGWLAALGSRVFLLTRL